MRDKVFLDTGVLIYGYSRPEFQKREIVRDIIASNDAYISMQVLQEFAYVLHENFQIKWPDISYAIYEVKNNVKIHTNSYVTMMFACKHMGYHSHYSFNERLIISAAQEANCTVLFSDVLNHNQKLDKLRIINPFIKL